MTEIVGCGRTVAGGFVAYDVQWDGPLEGRRVRWNMEVSGSDDDEAVRLVHEHTDREFSAQYVEDTTTGETRSSKPDADCRDHEITVRFPAELVGVAVEWPVWRAVLEVDGEAVSAMVVPTP